MPHAALRLDTFTQPATSHDFPPLLITMLNSVSNYLYERRAKFARTVGVTGGLYLASQYATASIADMRHGVLEQRAARERYVLVDSPSSLLHRR